MKYVSSLSGGIASAVAHARAMERYGKDNVIAWFSDTLWEDDDLYRFLEDLENLWGQKIIRHTEGIVPLQVAERRGIMPSSKLAPCSKELKREPFRKFIDTLEKPVTVMLGLDWHEQHRMISPKEYYESISGVSVEYPLMWKPYDFDVFETVKSWGIKIPRLYSMGFSHNNCGGRCVRQGKSEWRRLKIYFPERFEEVKNWELNARENNEKLKDYAICRDQSGDDVVGITLEEIEKIEKEGEDFGKQEDLFGCFCSY